MEGSKRRHRRSIKRNEDDVKMIAKLTAITKHQRGLGRYTLDAGIRWAKCVGWYASGTVTRAVGEDDVDDVDERSDDGDEGGRSGIREHRRSDAVVGRDEG